ncbi:phenazine biosynthesis-like protein [Aspergillus karnatakaensis]|uniref:PhzF family phenazine biosynthesis protein n=1 Tax=Aspergillus karnatakaensis TaxID=1810916 RepID=UPI003CCD7911
MSRKTASFVTLDVFTGNAFAGNKLAVVKIEKGHLSKAQKQSIARQFNFSETVFLDYADPSDLPRLEIFTPVNEMDFAGHPVTGTDRVLFRQLLKDLPSPIADSIEAMTLLTPAGPIALRYDPASQVVSAGIPHNAHLHSKPIPMHRLGVTYALVDLTNTPDIFDAVSAGPSPFIDLDDGWSPSFTGTMYYFDTSRARLEQDMAIQDLCVRMVAIGLEDPACGSGSAALVACLALRDGRKDGKYRFNFDQGMEIGIQSYITV